MAAPCREGDACLCKHTGVLATQQVSIDWKAWVPGSLNALRWELRRIFPSVGYELTRQQQVKHLVKQQYTKWEAVWTVFSMDIGSTFGRSMHSLRSNKLSDLMECEQEFWVKGTGLCQLLLFWFEHRKSPHHQNLALCVLTLWLEKTLLPDEILAMEVHVWQAAICEQCAEGRNIDGACHHVRRVCRTVELTQGCTPHYALMSVLRILYKYRECKARRGREVSRGMPSLG